VLKLCGALHHVTLVDRADVDRGDGDLHVPQEREESLECT
jgi:hypothetical protein